MKYQLVIIAIIMACSSIGLQAQKSGTRKLDRQTQGDQQYIKLAETLELSAEQKKELFEVLREEKRGTRSHKRGDRPTEEERAALQKERNDKVAEILNDEQLEKYLAIQTERSEKQAARKLEREKNKEAIEAYHEANIKPVLLSQRAKLEAVLTADEKALVQSLRDKGVRGKERQRRDRDRVRPSKEDMSALKTIIDNHKDVITPLLAEIKENKAVWDEELKSIRGEQSDRMGKGENKRDRIKERKQDRMEKRGEGRKRGNRGDNNNDYGAAMRLLLGDF